MKKKTKKKTWWIALSLSFLLILFILIFLNFLLRKEITLTNLQKNDLKAVFPEGHIKNIKLYQGGIVSIGSTKTLCKSIYFQKGSSFLLDSASFEGRASLIHEAMHTYQGRTTFGCFKMSIYSLYSQFISFLKYKSRNYAYYYTLNLSQDVFNSKKQYNPEQEAAIIEDYFYINYLKGNISYINCYGCNETDCFTCHNLYSTKFISDNLYSKSREILKKYSE